MALSAMNYLIISFFLFTS